MLLCAGCATCKGRSVPNKTPPSSQATRSHPGKEKSYKPKGLNEIMLPMRRKKSFTISEWGREKKRRPKPGGRKQRKKKQDEN